MGEREGRKIGEREGREGKDRREGGEVGGRREDRGWNEV